MLATSSESSIRTFNTKEGLPVVNFINHLANASAFAQVGSFIILASGAGSAVAGGYGFLQQLHQQLQDR
jgi:hypothetical protein